MISSTQLLFFRFPTRSENHEGVEKFCIVVVVGGYLGAARRLDFRSLYSYVFQPNATSVVSGGGSSEELSMAVVLKARG